jgi:hypothetical protein
MARLSLVLTEAAEMQAVFFSNDVDHDGLHLVYRFVFEVKNDSRFVGMG